MQENLKNHDEKSKRIKACLDMIQQYRQKIRKKRNVPFKNLKIEKPKLDFSTTSSLGEKNT